MMIDDHGQHGSDVSLDRGTTSSYVQRQFTSPSGEWNTLTFEGDIAASNFPEGRWMTIEVNGNQVFAATTQQTPPGNTQEKFAIIVPFPASNSADVKIFQGQTPAWGEYFLMDFYSLKLSNEDIAQPLVAGPLSMNIPPQEEIIVANMTEPETTVPGQ